MGSVIDRWTDTVVFRGMLLVAGLAVLPVLAVGALTTVIGGALLISQRSAVDLTQAAFALLSAGGVLGFIGYVRAHRGARDPDGHNVAATLVCLTAGVAAALVVAGFAVAGVLNVWMDPWRDRLWATTPALFAAANVVWALSGIAWMHRLTCRYAEETGRAFDSLPVMLLLIAIALVIAAGLRTAAL